ncbi:hypothetical protein GQ42DRAFT_6213 [Ramicandelaber brevisporus]|nr:hypothetical protein GQ42DRAFT_6213 [Ramicandelaber brevisporus]
MITTADFLRAHLHQLIRTASAGDLSDISDMLASSSDFANKRRKLNVAAFAIFDLPFELCVMIASHFSQAESAKVITVNRVFHEVFAQRIWNHLRIDDDLMRIIPEPAWQHYGHLVRTASVTCITLRGWLLRHIPNLIRMEVDIMALSDEFYDHNMQRLYSLKVCLRDIGSIAVEHQLGRLIAWNESVHCNNQLAQVEFDVHLTTPVDNTALAKLAGIIKTSSRRFYSFQVQVRDNAEVFKHGNTSVLPLMLTQLCLAGLHGDLCAFSLNFFDPSVVYPRLHTLHLQLYSNDTSSSVDTLNVYPDHFPSLSSLRITRNQYASPALSFHQRFFARTWRSITKLQLNCPPCPQTFAAIIRNVPCLEHLELFICRFKLDISLLTRSVPQLKSLYVLTPSIHLTEMFSFDQHSHNLQKLVQLHTLSVHNMDLDNPVHLSAGLLHFITHCTPNLLHLTIQAFSDRDNNLDRIHGHPLVSVRSLNVKCGKYGFSEQEVFKLADHAPTLRSLNLYYPEDEDICTRLQEYYPLVKVNLIK